MYFSFFRPDPLTLDTGIYDTGIYDSARPDTGILLSFAVAIMCRECLINQRGRN
jgi:hypothetical protein